MLGDDAAGSRCSTFLEGPECVWPISTWRMFQPIASLHSFAAFELNKVTTVAAICTLYFANAGVSSTVSFLSADYTL